MPREYYADKFDTKKRVKLHVFVPPSMYEELETLFAEHGQTIQEGVVGMLRNELRNTSLGVEGSWGKVTPYVIDVPAGKARRFAAILARAQAKENEKYSTGEAEDNEGTQAEDAAVAPTRPENRPAQPAVRSVLATAPGNQPTPPERPKPQEPLPVRTLTDDLDYDLQEYNAFRRRCRQTDITMDEFQPIRTAWIAKTGFQPKPRVRPPTDAKASG